MMDKVKYIPCQHDEIQEYLNKSKGKRKYPKHKLASKYKNLYSR